IRGELLSVRLPRRIVPSCVSEPTGCALPLRTNSTPAMNVVLTAPIPGKRTPNLPFGGAIFAGFSIQLPYFQRFHCGRDGRPRKNAYKQTSSITHTGTWLQMASKNITSEIAPGGVWLAGTRGKRGKRTRLEAAALLGVENRA